MNSKYGTVGIDSYLADKMAESQLKISCYQNAEFSDESYWFARNSRSDNISQMLFRDLVLQVPVDMGRFKELVFHQLSDEHIAVHKLTPDFKGYVFLEVTTCKVDRKKVGAKIPIWKFKCNEIPDDARFVSGAVGFDIILMPIATKSSSTKVRGGSSYSPLQIIKQVTSTFIAEQQSHCTMGNPLNPCFSKLDFTGTIEARKKAISAVIILNCPNNVMQIDAAIEDAGDNLKGLLVIERLKDKLANLDMNSQFPVNCSFRRVGAPEKAWRVEAPAAAREEDDHDEGPVPKRIKLEKYACECTSRSAKRGIALPLLLTMCNNTIS